MAAMKAGVKPHRMFLLELGGTTHRFTSASRDVSYDGETWNSNTPLLDVRPVGSADQNGTLELVLNDLALTWKTRFDLLGESGKDVEVHDAVPYGADLYWPKSVFIGRTVRVAPLRPRRGSGDGYRIGVECADAAAVPTGENAQWATHAFQQELVKLTPGVIADNSHIIVNKARTLGWHS